MDTSGDQRLDFEEFKATLLHLDRQLKSLPATAQVASQQGKYLGRLLSQTNGEVLTQSKAELEKKGLAPFEYHHLGSFAYVGDNKAVLQVPIFGEFMDRVAKQFLCLFSEKQCYTVPNQLYVAIRQVSSSNRLKCVL